jgi:CRP-like cAMP-binding protein
LITQHGYSEQDWILTEKYFRVYKIDAKKLFVKDGQIADKLGFVSYGLLRSYYFDEKGNERTSQFFLPGQVVVIPDSFNDGVPSTVNIASYERSALVTISSSDMKELYKIAPFWRTICHRVSDIKQKKLLDRTKQFQTQTAKERYQDFTKKYPSLILKVPLGHIASYLGMDIATLSRLRSLR